jgi:methionine-rich copper-binding protein CopC
VAAFLVVLTAARPAAAASSPCGATVNPITCENSQTAGVTDQSTWDITDAGESTIQGFSTDISVNAGGSIGLKIDTTLSAYTIDVYRLGYYGGHGARLWAGNVSHSAPKHQPACLTDPSTLLYDCGNWSLSATWNVPSTAVSGVYIAHLVGTNGDSSHITFIVRNDSSTSDVVYQTSDPTWQAYNMYGGSDFYQGTQALTSSQARAFKISYNRPFATRGANSGRDFLFSNEYPTIRFLERNGYDVSYISGVDTDRFGATQLTQHKVFMSVGHDEYWSQAQRTNVENARDAGVNMMFLSGNEVYWRTRYEPSIDGSNTSYRTLVCYKQTWDDSQTDPTGASTATYRDPRFAAGKTGGYPENALTGQMFRANSDDLAIKVSGAEGKNRLWRNTNLGSVADTSTTTLAPHTIGYESDETFDNGYSPAGLIKLSTTTGASPQILTDFGSTVVPGNTTHHLTLYRAASGALVFGAGTIQWGWGLDQVHDGDNSNPADTRIQQATINMLADMSALATTIMPGMTAATTSIDTTAPTSTVTSPAAGASLANGTTIAVTGTSVDNGGGRVAGVEVSLDGGSTWHTAAGASSWTYTGVLHGTGASTIRVRATDDSANIETPVQRAVTVNCSCSLFGTAVPGSVDSGDTSGVELGIRFTADTDGYVSGIRFYKSSANTGSHIGSLWTSSGSLLATGTFASETASGWQTMSFGSPIAVTAGTTYVASYFAPNGHYSADGSYFYYKNYDATPLHAAPTLPGGSMNGVYGDGHGYPSSSFKAGNYYVDVAFSTSATVPPSVTARTPTPGASSIALDVKPTASFSKAMDAASIAFSVTDPANNTVAGSVSYDPTSKTATFTPSAALANGTLYAVAVTGTDTNGNAISPASSWNFRTVYAGQTGGSCPCSLFTDSTVPATVSVNDPGSVELGIKFTADTDGIATGVRFYKGPQNTGTHTGTLWSSTGTQLATATFSNETSTGWQTVNFASPISLTAGSTYIASYHASVGYYSATSNAYASTGVDNFPLHAPPHASVYNYGTAFPTNGSDADYGVDVVFTVPASTVATVTSSSPSDGDSGIGTGSTISATFNTAVISGTPVVTLTPQGGSPAAGTTSLDATHRVLTFKPSAALQGGANYTLSISGARTLAGTPMASSITVNFSTGGGSTCPCRLFASNDIPAQIDSNDASSLSLGTQIVPAGSGFITGVRFYKAAANTGTHIGSLWSSSGTRLATVTFTNETGSGWQQAIFANPVAVTAGTMYVVSYYAPVGHYSASSHYFDTTYTSGPLSVPGPGNGVYRYGGDAFPSDSYGNTNYWVDATFTTTVPADTTPPTVTSSSPIDGSTSQSSSAAPAAVFSEPLTPASVVMTLKDAGGVDVAGAVSYDANTKTATFTPSGALTRGVKYTVSATASDMAGNAMPAPSTWTFTTAQPSPSAGVCPCSVWDDAATPGTMSDTDTRAIDLGVAFTADTTGQVTGVRFYKGPSNTGTHTGALWTSSGTQLATGTFSSESTAGWQTLTFASPVAIAANTSYVVSYHTSTGAFSSNDLAFQATGLDRAPLHVAAHAGRYLYGAGAFPSTVSDTNYWVDPVFVPATADTTAPSISAMAASPSASAAAVTWTTNETSTSRVDYGTSPSALTSSATSAALVTSHAVNLTGLTSATTYYYRVSSADASANSATLPIPTDPPASFVSADTAAPVISTVAAVAASSTSATITWTTDEAASTRVDYGTSAASLNLNASVAGVVTSHSITLTGLAVNTRYYFRVTSADQSANSATAPAAPAAPSSYAPAVTPFSQTSIADFSTGSSVSTLVSGNGAGEVVLAPTASAEFAGATLPAGWTSTNGAGGSTTVAGGVATVKNATLSSTATYASGKALEAMVTLAANQSVGWVTSSNASVKISLTVTGTNLIANVNDGFFINSTATAMTGWTATPHKVRIEWAANSVTFYVDDVQRYTRSFNSFYSNLRPALSDTSTAAPDLVVAWIRVGPYAASGTYTSKIFDASAAVNWGAISWDAVLPTGTTLTVRVRTGNTAVPDASWSAYQTIAASGGAVGATGAGTRYAQYQLTLTSSGSRFTTPAIRGVIIAFSI